MTIYITCRIFGFFYSLFLQVFKVHFVVCHILLAICFSTDNKMLNKERQLLECQKYCQLSFFENKIALSCFQKLFINLEIMSMSLLFIQLNLRRLLITKKVSLHIFFTLYKISETVNFQLKRQSIPCVVFFICDYLFLFFFILEMVFTLYIM